MGLLLATGEIKLDEAIEKAQPNLPVIGRADHLGRVVAAAKELNASTVLLYEGIPASQMDGVPVGKKLLHVIHDLRNLDIRVVFIASDNETNRPLLQFCVNYGVVDIIVSNSIHVNNIVEHINHPGSIANVKQYLPSINEVQVSRTRMEPTEIIQDAKVIEVAQDNVEKKTEHNEPHSKQQEKNKVRIRDKIQQMIPNIPVEIPKRPLQNLVKRNDKTSSSENIGTILVVGGNHKAGKTWIISTIFGLLSERVGVLAIDRDGTLSALWRVEYSDDPQKVKGYSDIVSDRSLDKLEYYQRKYQLIIIETDDIVEWLQSGYNCIVVVDSDPFDYGDALESEWNQTDWDDQLHVCFNRTPHTFTQQITGPFAKHPCYQIANQSIPIQMVVRQEEPVLATPSTFRSYINQLVGSRQKKI